MTTAEQHQVERAQLGAATATVVRGMWTGVDPERLEQSWLARVAAAALLIQQGQVAAASSAQPWLESQVGPGEGVIVPEAAAAAAAGDLAVPLMYPLLITLNRIGRGFATGLSILSGAAFLEMAVRSLVADAGRIADMAGMIARPRVVSYVRVVELPACARCIILAGREYSLSQGFLRHPRCNCTLAPKRPGDGWRLQPPEQLLGQMTEAQQRRAFGAAALEAVGAGADLTQVINARRGMAPATVHGRTVQATTEGTTRRGMAGKRLANFQKAAGQRYEVSRTPRLMPEEIFRLADDREHAIRLLKKHGYIV